MENLIEGSCLCGSVKMGMTKAPETFLACHCRICRTWGGGPLLGIASDQNLKIEGHEYIQVYDSSEWADRGFCKNCGTHLFFRVKKNQHVFPSIGLFGDLISPKFKDQWFIDKKPAYYSFSNETKNITEAEALKMLDDFLSDGK